MALRIVSVKMDDAIIEKLDEVAKSHHRKRSPEINVAVEFYLKYQGVDLETLKAPKDLEPTRDVQEERTQVENDEFQLV